MLSVTARKIREHGTERPTSSSASPANASRVYTGYLVNLPQIGRGMVLFRDPHGHRMITTPVRRLLREAGGKMLYVETDNSVYRLELHGELVPMTIETQPASASDLCLDITSGVSDISDEAAASTGSTIPAGE